MKPKFNANDKVLLKNYLEDFGERYQGRITGITKEAYTGQYLYEVAIGNYTLNYIKAKDLELVKIKI